ncbi:sporulation-control protein [Saccharothrix saharensis]|uniref:Sporulation-control protein n=1 Tax=Saccharothrix saharensis TaxID=571190 RepID=A0A543JB04_9PSEU|nr:sporulation protein [Saccharothrix saharensis]TQM79971.1 sporulation-control protein [Saccharothrix saharensis]
MFSRMLSAFGIGGPSVDTVLDSPHVVPGRHITGQVHIQGGSSDAEIDQVVLSLVTQVEVEHGGLSGFGGFGGDDENEGTAEFFRMVVQQGLRVPAGRLVSIPFQLPVPWETPITAVGGAALPGSSVGVRTELLVAGAPDKGDFDPVLVAPLPVQNKVLDAFGRLGFSFRGTHVEAGRLPGVPHEFGFHQKLGFSPPAQFADRVDQVESTFVANADELHVILEADRRRGGFPSGGGTSGHLRLSHQEAQVTDCAAAISGRLAHVAERGRPNPAFGGAAHNPAFGGQAGYGGQPGCGGRGHDHDDYDPRSRRRGSGMGSMLAAGAAGAASGVLGGMAINSVAGELFGDDEG